MPKQEIEVLKVFWTEPASYFPPLLQVFMLSDARFNEHTGELQESFQIY